MFYNPLGYIAVAYDLLTYFVRITIVCSLIFPSICSILSATSRILRTIVPLGAVKLSCTYPYRI